MLAEVLAAVAVVAIGLSALASAIPVAGAAVSEGARLSTATFLAGARLEEIRAAAWSATPAVDRLGVSGAPLSPPESEGATTFADETALPDPYAGYSRQVTVTVAYRPVTATGVAAIDKSVSVTTLVAQR